MMTKCFTFYTIIYLYCDSHENVHLRVRRDNFKQVSAFDLLKKTIYGNQIISVMYREILTIFISYQLIELLLLEVQCWANFRYI